MNVNSVNNSFTKYFNYGQRICRNFTLCFHGDRVYRGWLILGPAFLFLNKVFSYVLVNLL
jgi:hypothetical protein